MSQRSTVRARDGAKCFLTATKTIIILKLGYIFQYSLSKKTAKYTAFLSERSKEKYLRYFIREYAWVRIPQNAKFDSIQQPKIFNMIDLKTESAK